MKSNKQIQQDAALKLQAKKKLVSSSSNQYLKKPPCSSAAPSTSRPSQSIPSNLLLSPPESIESKKPPVYSQLQQIPKNPNSLKKQPAVKSKTPSQCSSSLSVDSNGRQQQIHLNQPESRLRKGTQKLHQQQSQSSLSNRSDLQVQPEVPCDHNIFQQSISMSDSRDEEQSITKVVTKKKNTGRGSGTSNVVNYKRQLQNQSPGPTHQIVNQILKTSSKPGNMFKRQSKTPRQQQLVGLQTNNMDNPNWAGMIKRAQSPQTQLLANRMPITTYQSPKQFSQMKSLIGGQGSHIPGTDIKIATSKITPITEISLYSGAKQRQAYTIC